MFFGDPYSFLTDYPPFRWVKHCYPCDFITTYCLPIKKIFSYLGRGSLLFHRWLPDKKLNVVYRSKHKCRVGQKGKQKLHLSEEVLLSAKKLALENARNKSSCLSSSVKDIHEAVSNLEKLISIGR